MDPEFINNFSNSSLFHILEFASVSGIIIVTYLAMHSMFGRMKQPTKMLFAMFLGSLAYGLGKVFLLGLIIKPMVF